MHTVKILSIAFALLAICLGVARFRGASLATGAKWFVPLWFIGAAINMYVGIARAGYTFREEVPFFLIVFSIPTAVAALAWWKYKGR